MTEHRVSVLSSRLRRYEDPAQSRDPRIRSLVDQLGSLQTAPEPRPHFRAELRAQLVAVAPRIIAESKAEDDSMVDIVPRPSPAPRVARPAVEREQVTPIRTRLQSVRVGRALGIAASVITVFTLLLGGAAWMSQKAQPGDSLYGLKRASERVELALDTSDTARAQDHLTFAARRVTEARDLLSRPSASGTGPAADGAVSPHTAALVTKALRDADSDTRNASRLLGDEAVDSGSPKPLTAMTDWAPAQLRRLDELAAAVPAGALRSSTSGSISLVHQAAARASTLQQKVDCHCMSKTSTDSLGPVPCVRCAAAAPGGSTTTTRHSGGSSAPTSTAPAGKPAPGQRTGGTQGTAPVQGPLTATPRTSTSTPKPGLPLPSLPNLPLPTKSSSGPLISINSCGIKLLILTVPLCSSTTP